MTFSQTSPIERAVQAWFKGFQKVFQWFELHLFRLSYNGHCSVVVRCMVHGPLNFEIFFNLKMQQAPQVQVRERETMTKQKHCKTFN
jgi:hypothetical protein